MESNLIGNINSTVDPYDPTSFGTIATDNVVFGAILLRQLKIRANSCEDRYKLNTLCYSPDFTPDVEDTSTFGPGTSPFVYTNDVLDIPNFHARDGNNYASGGGFVERLPSNDSAEAVNRVHVTFI